MALTPEKIDLELNSLADRVLAGAELDRATARVVLEWPNDTLHELLAATLRVRAVAFGRRVKICVLRNAQSGICPEDCHYCSQSRISRAEIPVYRLQSVEELVEGARLAVASGARRYCMACSMRGPNANDIDRFSAACSQIRAEFPALELCLSLGLMSREQAARLKARGRGLG